MYGNRIFYWINEYLFIFLIGSFLVVFFIRVHLKLDSFGNIIVVEFCPLNHWMIELFLLYSSRDQYTFVWIVCKCSDVEDQYKRHWWTSRCVQAPDYQRHFEDLLWSTCDTRWNVHVVGHQYLMLTYHRRMYAENRQSLHQAWADIFANLVRIGSTSMHSASNWTQYFWVCLCRRHRHIHHQLEVIRVPLQQSITPFCRIAQFEMQTEMRVEVENYNPKK